MFAKFSNKLTNLKTKMLLNQIINFVLLASGMLVDYATKMISQQNDNLLSSSPPQHDPLLLWLSGGPGCSSLFGVCGEIGPILIDTNGKLTFNPYFWNQKTNFLFIKSPAGAGFSHGKRFCKKVASHSQIWYRWKA